MTESLAPGFLIATPRILDENFDHTVVFLLEHGDDGTLGLIINRPSDMTVANLLARIGVGYAGDPNVRVLAGGPVQPDNILVLHREGNAPGDSREISPSLFVGATQAALTRLYGKPESRTLCFAGYAGWGPGQLEAEMARGDWIPVSLDPSLIFEPGRESLWQRLLRELGIDPAVLVAGDNGGERN